MVHLFAGDAVFTVGFNQPGGHNGFEHDPEEAAAFGSGLCGSWRETGALLMATLLPFPSIGRVAVVGDAFASFRSSGITDRFGLRRQTGAHAGEHHRDVATLGVRKSSTAWPDLAVAAVMTGISLTSSVQKLRQAWTRDRTSAVLVAADATKGICQTLPRDRSHTEHGPKSEGIQHHVCSASAASIPCV